MSEQYTAWDGNDYPWPPPEGWVLGSDGRYWPDGQQPTDEISPGTQPQGFAAPPAGAMPPPAGMPPPGGMAPGGMGQGGMAPGASYGSVPPPGQPAPVQQAPGTYTYGAAPAKSSKAGWWILGIILAIMAFGLGGCLLIASVISRGASELGESLEDFEDDFTRRNEATQAISVSSCSVEGGVPTASGTVTNPRDQDSSYFISIDFIETGTGTLLGSADTSIFDIGSGDSEPWELQAPVSGIEGAIQCERSSNSIRMAD